MEKNLAMIKYLETLYVPVGLRLAYDDCIKFLAQAKLRDIDKSDEGRNAVPMVLIHTAGRGVRTSFKGYGFARVDFNEIGNSYCEAVIKEADTAGYPCRLFNRSNRCAVII